MTFARRILLVASDHRFSQIVQTHLHKTFLLTAPVIRFDDLAQLVSRETDGLREHGGLSGARDSVQRLIPPVVGGNSKPGDLGRGILHLQDLFFESHAGDQVRGAPLRWEIRIGFRCAATMR